MKNFTLTRYTVTSLVLLAASPAMAQHSDVLLVDVGGQVTIGSAADIDTVDESFDLDTIVFESIFAPGSILPTPADYETTEPGFFGLHGVKDAADLATLGASALPGNASVSINLANFKVDGVSSDLFYWDGTGAVDFNPAPAGTSFNFDPSIGFATTNPNGDMDDHPIFELDATSGVPADGVYVISPVVDVAGLATSDRFFLVFLADALITDEDDLEAVEEALELLEEGVTTDAIALGKDFAFYEEAVEFVEGTLAVPEPTTAMLSLLALSLLTMRRASTLS